MEMGLIFFLKELCLLANGKMMKRLQVKWFCLMEINSKDNLETTTDTGVFTTIKMVMSMMENG